MTHRVLLVGGNDIERMRLEGSLRNVGLSALAAVDAPQAALLCRQFGPSVVLALTTPASEEGRTLLPLLQNHPATAAVPIVALGLDVTPVDVAVTSLRTLAGLMAAPRTGADLVARLDALFGDDSRDLRRRISFHRRGPAGLRRIGDHMRLMRKSGVVTITGTVSPAFVEFEEGRLKDAAAGILRGAQAIKAMLGDADERPWGFSFSADRVVGAVPAPILTSPAEPAVIAAVPEAVAAVIEGLAVDADSDDNDDADDELDDRSPEDRYGPGPLPARHDVEQRPMTLLIVDDDPALIMLYERTLAHGGHRVHTATDGARGLEAALSLRPDVIISDIAMPGKNGWDLLAGVRADPRLAETPFLLLSCHGDFLRGLQKADAGADDYVEKGIRTAALRERIEKVVAGRARLATWGDVPPPSFRERMASLGLFPLMRALERARADGEVVVDDGWVDVRLHLVGGQLVNASAVEADGAAIDGLAAVAAALERPEASVEFRAGEAPPGPPTMARSPSDALEAAALLVDTRRRQAREAALEGNARLIFRERAADLYFLVADEVTVGLAKRFADGATPRDALASGTVDPLLVEWVVKDLLVKGVANLMV